MRKGGKQHLKLRRAHSYFYTTVKKKSDRTFDRVASTIRSKHTPHNSNILRRQIEAIDDEIDQQIYRLYELTEAQIKQVAAIFSAQS
jgi:hypothetical protein